MKRKVVQQGPATLMISLPSKWVKENSIKRGDEIEVIEEKGKLTLALEAAQTKNTKEIDAKSIRILNEYFVNYLYQKGYDEVTFRYDDPQLAEIIKKRAKQLIGLEVVEQGKNFTKLKMLMATDQEEFDTVLKKLFYITLVMGDKITEALVQKNKALLEEVKEDEKENNKYCDLCMRILYKNRYKYPENGFALYSLLRELEQVGDIYKNLAHAFVDAQTKPLQEVYTRTHAFFRVYYELYYAYDEQKAQRFFQLKTDLLEECKKLLTDATKEELLVLFPLASLIQKIFDLKGVMFLQQI